MSSIYLGRLFLSSRTVPRAVLLLLVLATCPAQHANASLVFSWSISNSVRAPGGNGPVNWFNQAHFPFNETSNLTYQNSMSNVTYDFIRNPSFVDFDLTADLTGQGSPPIFTSSASGLVTFTTTEPVLISVDASFTYNLAPGDRRAEFGIIAGDANGPVFQKSYSSEPIFGDPNSGTWTIHADSLYVPPGHTGGFNYSFGLSAYSGSPDLLSTGHGTLNVHIDRNVPEPATITLLALAAPLVLHRRRI